MKWRLSLVTTLGVVLIFGAYLSFTSKRPLAPAVPQLSGCNALGPGMRRIGDRGFQFDVPTSELTISEGTSDAAPLVHGFGLRPKERKSILSIEFGPQSLKSMMVDPAFIFSKHVEKRRIVDDKGKSLGEDEWGYLDSGERWRRVRFPGGGTAKYGFVNENEAALFDQVINSVCFATLSER